jgi:hypothetical protein
MIFSEPFSISQLISSLPLHDVPINFLSSMSPFALPNNRVLLYPFLPCLWTYILSLVTFSSHHQFTHSFTWRTKQTWIYRLYILCTA